MNKNIELSDEELELLITGLHCIDECGYNVYSRTCTPWSEAKEMNMKHKFTVVIESNDDSEDREVVKDCLKDWLEMNCGHETWSLRYPRRELSLSQKEVAYEEINNLRRTRD